MKLVTNDYGCGTSSSILDYGINDVVVVSEQNYEHIFDVQDDLFFIGHDFLFYLWDNQKKLDRWISRSQKYEHWVWCFERVEAIFPIWREKSYTSLSLTRKFCKRTFACDEDDCNIHRFEWLPQWASNKFFKLRDKKPEFNHALFSGQAAKPEYVSRTQLIVDIQKDSVLKDILRVTNISRNMTWDQYIDNFLKYPAILNPVGTLKALNTRAYEAMYSGRILLQQTLGKYERHEKMLQNCPGIILFDNINTLKQKLKKFEIIESNEGYKNNSLYARMKMIGIDIK